MGFFPFFFFSEEKSKERERTKKYIFSLSGVVDASLKNICSLFLSFVRLGFSLLPFNFRTIRTVVAAACSFHLILLLVRAHISWHEGANERVGTTTKKEIMKEKVKEQIKM